MQRYAITERAGPFVAGIRNTGVGTVLVLTERQAEYELRLGTLVWLPEPQETAAAVAGVDPAPMTSASLEPTHYRLTVSRPVSASGMNFNPGSRYTVKAAVHDALKEQAADAIATAEPMLME